MVTGESIAGMATGPMLKRSLHWQYSSIALPLLFATAVGFMLADKYIAAYAAYALTGVWSIGWWLTHDAVQSRRDFLQKQIKKKRLTKRARISFWKMICAGVIPIAGIVVAGIVYTHHIETEESLKAYYGWLYPDTIPDPYGMCKPNADQLAMYVGSYSLLGNSFPQSLVAIHSVPTIIIDRRGDGAIALSLTIRSDDQRVIVEMDDGEFTVNPNNILRMYRPDKSQLVIKDQLGNEVLNAHYLNKNAIRLAAKFYQDGKVYDLSAVPLHNTCLERIVPPGTHVTGNMINLDPKQP